MKLKGKNIYIGIDIGASSIKAVEIEIGLTGESTLKRANLVSAPEGLKKAISGMSLKNAKVICVIDCPKTCVRYITVPIMPDKELAEAIKWEAKDDIPFSLDEAVMDYEVQEEVEESGVKKLKVRLAASPTETVNNIMNLLSEAAIEPISIIEPPLALERLARHLNLKAEETTALIDIGYEVTEICIVKNNLLKFHRKVTSGGNAITKAMVGALVSDQGRVELNEEDAEKIKQQYGIPKEEETVLIDGKISPTQLKSLVRPAVERLSKEIERSFEYYREESGGDRIGSIVLLGGSAQLKGLAEYLQDNFGVPVSIGNPLKGINVAKGAIGNLEAASHRFGVTLGAALTEGRGINLLPKELKEKTKRTFKRAGIEAVAAAIAVILILTFIGMKLQLANYNKKISAANLELKTMLPQLQIASSYERVQDELSQRNALIDGILSNSPPWKEVFKELSNIVPKEVVLTEMSMVDNTLVMKGEILGAAKNREEILSNFISILEDGTFKHVSLVTAKMGEEEKGKSEFEIKCVCSTE